MLLSNYGICGNNKSRVIKNQEASDESSINNRHDTRRHDTFAVRSFCAPFHNSNKYSQP